MMQMGSAMTTLEGNLTSDPEIRTTPAGIPVANFRMAASDRRKNQETGEWEDTSTVYMRVTCWRGMASNVKATLHKGDPVVVTGRLQSHTYVLDEQQRTSLELVASAVGPNLARGYAIFHRVHSGAPVLKPVPVEQVEPIEQADEVAAA